MQSFQISEAIRASWQIVKSNLGFFIGLMLIIFVFQFVSGYVGEYFDQLDTFNPVLILAAVVYYVVSFVIGVMLSLWQLIVSLAFVDGSKGTFADIKKTPQYIVKTVLANILVGLVVLGGFLLLIIPGIIWALKYKYTIYAIIDKKMDVMDAFKYSGNITNGVKFDLLLFGLAFVLINVLGLLALVVGLFITIPMTIVADVWIYRTLQKQYDEREGSVTKEAFDSKVTA